MYPPDLGPGKHGCGDELVFVHFLLEHSPPALLEQLQLLAVPGNDEPVDTANKEALRPSCASGTRWERAAGPSPAPHFILSRCPARPGLRLSSFSLSCSLPQDPPGTTQDVRATGSPLITFTVWEHPRGTCLFPSVGSSPLFLPLGVAGHVFTVLAWARTQGLGGGETMP